jgi:hypothetical protein
MQRKPLILSICVLFAIPANAQTPSVPAEAKQLSGAEIGAWLDGKSLSVEIFDAGVPVTATTNWDLARQRVSGDFNANGTTGNFDNEWTIQGDTSCAEKSSDGAWICQKIFVLGDTMYEVTADGKLHAVSIVK